MKHLDLTLPSPAENLAGDEALLDWCEENEGEEALRFWESPETFVVVGYANKIAAEVNVATCEAKGIPIFRRCSGGGLSLAGCCAVSPTCGGELRQRTPVSGPRSADPGRRTPVAAAAVASPGNPIPAMRPSAPINPSAPITGR